MVITLALSVIAGGLLLLAASRPLPPTNAAMRCEFLSDCSMILQCNIAELLRRRDANRCIIAICMGHRKFSCATGARRISGRNNIALREVCPLEVYRSRAGAAKEAGE